MSLSAFAPENLASRDRFGSPVPVSLLISILRLNLVLTSGIPPEFQYPKMIEPLAHECRQ